MRVASQSERLIMVSRVMIWKACQGCLSNSSIFIYSLCIVVGEDLTWKVIRWDLQKKLAIWTLRSGLIISISLMNACSTHTYTYTMRALSREIKTHLQPSYPSALTLFNIISHNKPPLPNKQDSVAEWLSRLVAIQIPLGAQVRVLPLSFGCFCSDLTRGIEYSSHPEVTHDARVLASWEGDCDAFTNSGSMNNRFESFLVCLMA